MFSHEFTESTMLASCEYDPETKELMVEFKNGKKYYYVDVDPAIYADLITANSPGRNFNSVKKDLVQK
jgi:hypothetical protein